MAADIGSDTADDIDADTGVVSERGKRVSTDDFNPVIAFHRRRTTMPVFEPEAKPVKKVVFSARVDPSIVETLRAYCDFLNSSSQHHVMRTVAKSRVAASAVVAVVTWAFGHFHTPFPAANDLIVLVANAAPHVVAVVRLAYTVMWFTSRSSSAPSCCRSATYSW